MVVTVTPATSSSSTLSPAAESRARERGERDQLVEPSVRHLGIGRHQDKSRVRLAAVVADRRRPVADPADELLQVGAERRLDGCDLLLALGRGGNGVGDRPDHGAQRRADVGGLAVVEDVAGHLGGQAAVRVLGCERTGRRFHGHVEHQPVTAGGDRHRAAQRLVLEQRLEGRHDLRRSRWRGAGRLRQQVGHVVGREDEPVVGQLLHQPAKLRKLGQRARAGGMGVQSSAHAIGVVGEDQLVIGQGVRALTTRLVGVDGHAEVLALGEGRRPVPRFGDEAVDRGLGRGGIGDTEQDDERRRRRQGGRISQVGRVGEGLCGQVGERHRHAAIEPSRDVGRPADGGALLRQRRVDQLADLAVQRLREVDTLDRREVAEQLAHGSVLGGRRVETHLDEEGRIGRHVGRAGADRCRALGKQETAGRDADPDGECGNCGNDRGADGGGHGLARLPSTPALGGRAGARVARSEDDRAARVRPMPLSGVGAGVLAAIAFGAGDFAGALAARRAGALIVVAGAHSIGLVALLLATLVLQPPVPDLDAVLIGIGAGVAGAVGLAALYRGMALGSMGIVTSLSGAGSLAIPLVAGVLLGARITPVQVVGVACAAAAAAAASGATRDELGRRALLLAAVAALGFGAWYVLIDLAARAGDPLWALVCSRATSAVLASAFAIGRFDRARFPLRIVVAAGLFDVGGNALYVVARELMPIGLAAALTGLYPIVTMLLARTLLGERLPRLGQVGVGLALLGIVLISAGG